MKANASAFPILPTTGILGEFGLTKREWFAGQALASGVSPENAVKAADELVAELTKLHGYSPASPALAACRVVLEVIENRHHEVEDIVWRHLELMLRRAISQEGGEA